MARELHPVRFILLCTLTAFFFSGCAAGPQISQAPKSGKDEPIPVTTLSAPLQKALNAIEEADYEKAARHFDEIRKNDEEIQEEYLYDYALALSETGRYEEAIEQFTSYIANPARGGYTAAAAIAERTKAEQKLVATPRTNQAEANLSQTAGTVNDNWQPVQQQLDAGASSITDPLTGIEMVLISGGCYQMGDQFGDGNADEQPVHEVCLDDFYLGRHEVTQAQWQQVMGYNPSKYQQGGDFPVDMISWQEAMAFAETLASSKGRYRLPTEAEWEYAARSGGKTEKFSGSNNADQVAWHIGNSERTAHPIGQKQANGLGLHDMSGNAQEWCLDRYSAEYYAESPTQNPAGADAGNERTRRGGGWGSKVASTRTSYRNARDEEIFRNSSTGFRLALPVAGGK